MFSLSLLKCAFNSHGASIVVRLVKSLPTMQETPVQFLGWKDPLEKGQATHSRILGLPWWLFSDELKEVLCPEGTKMGYSMTGEIQKMLYLNVCLSWQMWRPTCT